MRTIFSAVACAAFLSIAAPAFAQDYIVLDRRADEFDAWQDRVDSTYGNPIVAREFDVPLEVIEEQRTRTELGYGGLMIANALARETGRSFDEIVAMKASGIGWGRIAQESGVKLGPIVSRLNRADQGFRAVKVKAKRGNGAVKAKGAKGNGRGKAKAFGHRDGKGKGHGRGGGKGRGKGKK